MSKTRRNHLEIKINKSKEVLHSLRISRMASNPLQAVNYYRSGLIKLKYELETTEINKIEELIRVNPHLASEEQSKKYSLCEEHKDKIDIVVGAADVLKIKIKDLTAKNSAIQTAQKIAEGEDFLNKIVIRLNEVYKNKWDFHLLNSIAEKLSANKVLTKVEKKLLDTVADGKRLSKADIQSLLSRHKLVVKENITNNEETIKKCYKDFYENILDVSFPSAANTKQIVTKEVPAVQQKAIQALFSFVDQHIPLQADMMKSKLKEIVKLMDRAVTFDKADHIAKLLKFISHDKFKYHFKDLVNKKLSELQAIFEKPDEKNQKTISELQSMAVQKVLNEYGFSLQINPAELIKAVDGMFKNAPELRSQLSTVSESLSEKEKMVSQENVYQTSIEADEKNETVETKKEIEPVAQCDTPVDVGSKNSVELPVPEVIWLDPIPAITKTPFGLFNAKATTDEIHPSTLVSRLLEKLRAKLSELEKAQLSPATSPQLRKHNLSHIFELRRTIANVDSNHTNITKVKELIMSDIEKGQFVNVVVKNMLETFVRQIDKATPEPVHMSLAAG